MICSVAWPAAWPWLLVGGLSSYLCGPLHKTTCLSFLGGMSPGCSVSAVPREREPERSYPFYDLTLEVREHGFCHILSVGRESLSPAHIHNEFWHSLKSPKYVWQTRGSSHILRWLYVFYCLEYVNMVYIVWFSNVKACLHFGINPSKLWENIFFT